MIILTVLIPDSNPHDSFAGTSAYESLEQFEACVWQDFEAERLLDLDNEDDPDEKAEVAKRCEERRTSFREWLAKIGDLPEFLTQGDRAVVGQHWVDPYDDNVWFLTYQPEFLTPEFT